MIRIKAPRLDWNRQFEALLPHFQGNGGVVHVRISEQSPTASFARAIRSELESRTEGRLWKTVELNPENSLTHYLSDITKQITRSLELILDSTIPASLNSTSISVADRVRAGGSVSAQVEINIQDDPYSRMDRELERLDALRVALKAYLTERNVALLFMNSHVWPVTELRNIRRRLWDDFLEEMTDAGLFLVCFHNDLMPNFDSLLWPPDPSLILDLPERFDDQARLAALEDLARMVLKSGHSSTQEEAWGLARGIIDTSSSISEVYSRMAILVAQGLTIS